MEKVISEAKLKYLEPKKEGKMIQKEVEFSNGIAILGDSSSDAVADRVSEIAGPLPLMVTDLPPTGAPMVTLPLDVVDAILLGHIRPCVQCYMWLATFECDDGAVCDNCKSLCAPNDLPLLRPAPHVWLATVANREIAAGRYAMTLHESRIKTAS